MHKTARFTLVDFDKKGDIKLFWNNFYNLCIEKGMKPLQVVKEIGIAHGSITKWKNGAMPNTKNLQKIADYFEISVEHLLEKEKATPASPLDNNKKELFDHIDQMTDEQLEQLKSFAKFLIESKNK